ncbi:hypothetical protein, partial [Bacillus salacetis]|uniref:hypothetical protein n=1 Tax=Bacillus salacetis TaxID=2315464 RepID=UPI00196BA32E
FLLSIFAQSVMVRETKYNSKSKKPIVTIISTLILLLLYTSSFNIVPYYRINILHKIFETFLTF